MKRLREQTSSPDPAVARAASMLLAVRPLDTAQVHRRRLPFEAAPRARAVPMRVALVLALSLASAIAGAETVHRAAWLRSWTGWRSSPGQPVVSAVVAPAPVVHAVAAAAKPAASTLDVAALPVAVASPAVTRGPSPASPRVAARSVIAASTASAAADESSLMVDAVRALRRDRDPRRAASLAQEALQRSPHGPQVEEAMAVAMEAASADGDGAAAHVWAERYLAAFPAGRFADRARQVRVATPR
ncbi:MAG TPA: hypothetical protein VKU41_33060 [Polyangiaceae bacterium]|nr:hypothetical protein [Polyangiaceae bacterium]